MATARQIIKQSLLKIGALVKTEDPSADEANDALLALNQLVQSWSNDASVIVSRAWETFTLQAGVSTYTMGAGGSFNTIRPINIVSGYIRNGSVDTPLTIIGDEAYNSIGFKSISGIPQFLDYDNANPVDNVRVYPVPSAAYSIFILSEKPLANIASLDTDIVFPPGWERALVYNLAVELAPEYNQPIDPRVEKIANESLSKIRIATIRARPMDAYPQVLTTRNVWSGWRS